MKWIYLLVFDFHYDIMQYMFLTINQCFSSVYMEFILWKIGQVYVGNKYCDVSSLGFHISVIVAINKKQITF